MFLFQALLGRWPERHRSVPLARKPEGRRRPGTPRKAARVSPAPRPRVGHEGRSETLN